jgi:serine/threonine protein kinase
VLELCAGTLKNYCEKKYNGRELPPDGLVLYQIANGLHYIHSRNLVHRDVKPDNILISMTTPVQMKLSDFGFVKKISPRGTFTQQSGLKGTLNWMAAEILELMDDSISKLPHGTIQSDTFAAGCVFFFFLTRGKHPFDSNSLKIPGNILDNKPVELNQHNQSKYFICICIMLVFTGELLDIFLITDLQGDDRALYELIEKMIKPKEERISLPEVIKHLTAKLHASSKSKFFFELNRNHYSFFIII